MRKNNRKILLYLLSFFLTNIALLSDSYKYPGFFNKYFFIDSKIIFFFFIFYLLYLFIKKENFLYQNKIIKSINLIYSFVCLILISLFSILEYSNYSNYVYNLFHINQIQFIFLFFISCFVFFLSLYPFFHKNPKAIITFFITGLFAYAFPLDHFIEINKEDHIIENTQFFIVLFASIYSLLISLFFRNKQKLFYFIFYLLISISLFILAAEEVSWGQRILKIQTPEFIKNTNVQQEISLHNQTEVSKYIAQTYLTLNFYGSFSFIIYEILKNKYKQKELFFESFFIKFYVAPFFFLKFIYDYIEVVLRTNVEFKFHSWSEYVELSMYLGILIHLIIIYYKYQYQIKMKGNYGKN